MEERQESSTRCDKAGTEKPSYMPSYAVELAVYTGMRAGELAGPKWKNVFMDERIIVISKSEKYNGINKEYYLSSTKIYESREFVFSISDGQIHCRTISDCMRNKCIQIGMKHTKGMNAVRRTVNSIMRCAGVSATVAASLLGHTEEVNQQNYTYDITKMDEILDFTRLSSILSTAGDGT